MKKSVMKVVVKALGLTALVTLLTLTVPVVHEWRPQTFSHISRYWSTRSTLIRLGLFIDQGSVRGRGPYQVLDTYAASRLWNLGGVYTLQIVSPDATGRIYTKSFLLSEPDPRINIGGSQESVKENIRTLRPDLAKKFWP